MTSVLAELGSDPRNPPELMRYFREHQRRWARGEVRLDAFGQGSYESEDGTPRMLWYAPPLGERVLPDKADLFESIGYRPSEPACYAHASLARYRTFSGGARAGKSLWAAMEILPVLLTPGAHIWIVGPEYTLCEKEFTYVLEMLEKEPIKSAVKPMLAKGKVRNSPKNGDMTIELGWGDAGMSWVRCRSAERKSSLLGESLDMVVVCEASQIADLVWSRYLAMRLTDTKGVALFPSTPNGTGNWFDGMYRAGMAGEEGHFTISADSRMNPKLDLTELEFASRHMTDADFDEQIRGRPTPRHGRIYTDFVPGIHCAWEERWPGESWLRGRTFDFGFADPFCVLWVAKDEDSRFYVYREFYQRRVLVGDVVKYIEGVEANEQMTLPSVSDWDASQRAELARAGIKTRKANKDILGGVRTITDLLRIRGDGKPGLYIHPSCRNLIREIGEYQWGQDSKPAMRQDDHALDALRYFVHTHAPKKRDLRIRVL